ncbi:MAG: flavin reductase [Candidatus Bipolaricaulota bacterium]|nr:flavin reductase [Candidatus Bipolaricaulota bacterium]
MGESRGGHTYDNILRMGEWCINLPVMEQREQCQKSIEYNGTDNDEITDAGFTVEPSRVILSPRITECLANMECTLEWHRPLFGEGGQHVFVGKVVHVAMDERACAVEPQQRLKALNTMFSRRDTLGSTDRRDQAWWSGDCPAAIAQRLHGGVPATHDLIPQRAASDTDQLARTV